MTTTIDLEKFQENCLSLLDELVPEGLVITKQGNPIAHVIPYRHTDADLIGCMQGSLEIRGNLFSTGVDWQTGRKDFEFDSQS